MSTLMAAWVTVDSVDGARRVVFHSVSWCPRAVAEGDGALHINYLSTVGKFIA
jgi:hypothetical protein